jgi:hypothetical protein
MGYDAVIGCDARLGVLDGQRLDLVRRRYRAPLASRQSL